MSNADAGAPALLPVGLEFQRIPLQINVFSNLCGTISAFLRHHRRLAPASLVQFPHPVSNPATVPQFGAHSSAVVRLQARGLR